jgi:hypothetical protein
MTLISPSHLAALFPPMVTLGREYAQAALLAQRDGERSPRDHHLAVHHTRFVALWHCAPGPQLSRSFGYSRLK